ncbi:MAG: glycosyltransferase [gamma proteobacterium symbiont of Taylorina sp.]|nr:glycosyltransferase [gamma proteobacterium symbiont of Taylorina sp.]
MAALIDVIIPVYNGFESFEKCISSVAKYTSKQHRVILIDDASTDNRIPDIINQYKESNLNITSILNNKNIGFVASINYAISQCKEHILILNSDTIVTPLWIEKLLSCLQSDSSIGIVCPLSNNATILSVPQINQNNPILAETPQEISLIMDLITPSYPRIPTAVGFCMLVHKQIFKSIGYFDEVFSPGYAEECDFSMRTWMAGFEIVCCDNLYIYHQGGASFDSIDSTDQNKRINAELLNLRWPGYLSAVKEFCYLNPLRTVQEKIRLNHQTDHNPQLLMVLHNSLKAGGTEIHSYEIAEGIKNKFNVSVIYPADLNPLWADMVDQNFDTGVAESDKDKHSKATANSIRNIAYQIENIKCNYYINNLPATIRNYLVEENFTRFLIGGQYPVIHFQHLAKWGTLALPLIAKKLGRQVIISLHDYYLLCPDYNMLLPNGNRCQKKSISANDNECIDCITLKQVYINANTNQSISEYIEQRQLLITNVLESSDCLIAPSEFVSNKFAQAFDPRIAEKIQIIPHGIKLPEAPVRYSMQKPILEVVCIGNLNQAKGAETIVKLAKKLQYKKINLSIIGGVSHEYQADLNKYGVNIHGFYQHEQLAHLLKSTDVALIPSTYDETFCLTLSEVQALGIPVIASRVGAITERVDHGVTGYLIPPNNANALLKQLLRLADDRHLLKILRHNLLQKQIKSIKDNIIDYDELYQKQTLHFRKKEKTIEPEIPSSTAIIKDLLNLPDMSNLSVLGNKSYNLWRLEQSHYEQLKRLSKINLTGKNLVIHFIILINPENAPYIQQTILSLKQRENKNCFLTLVTRFSELVNNQWKFDNSRLLTIKQGESLTHEINKEIHKVDAHWVACIQSGDSFSVCLPDLLQKHLLKNPGRELIYFDQDMITTEHKHYAPYFKPDFNLELLRAKNYIGNAFLIKQRHLISLGGFSEAMPLVAYNLTFLTLKMCGEKSIGHIDTILFHQLDINAKQSLQYDIKPVVKHHLQDFGIKANISNINSLTSNKIIYGLNKRPLISIIIAVRNNTHSLTRCLSSFVNLTSYKNYEFIIIDNFSDSLENLEKLKAELGFTLLLSNQAKNAAQLYNRAVQFAKGEQLLFLNDQIEIITPDWLNILVTYLQQPGIAIAACRLLNKNRVIVHDGYTLGMGEYGIAGDNCHTYSSVKSIYFNDRHLAKNISAVSIDCLLIHKEIYNQVDGLNEEMFPSLFFDVDLCLKVLAKNHKIVFTPYTALILHGTSSIVTMQTQGTKQASIEKETDEMFQQWLPQLSCDRAYNRNLSLQNSWKIETRVRVPFEKEKSITKKITVFPHDQWGGGHYRAIDPLKALENKGLCELAIYHTEKFKRIEYAPSVTEIARLGTDVLFMHNALSLKQLSKLRHYRDFSQCYKIFSLDDLIDLLPDYNPYSKTNHPDISEHLKTALSYCDRFVVSTAPLAEAYSKYHKDIVIIPNTISAERWKNRAVTRINSDKPRVGWAGAAQHFGDLEMIKSVISNLKDQVDWIFLGPCPDSIRPYLHEHYPMVDFEYYPDKLASLALDAAIAPLCDNAFNHAKSNLKLLEYGISGYPVVCSDITPYKGAPVIRVKNKKDEWIGAIQSLVQDRNTSISEGEKLRQWVQSNWMLEDQLDNWNSIIN